MDEPKVAVLRHYASPYYDPQKAHEYYMRTRELKGRSTTSLNDDGKKIWSYTKNNIKSEKAAKVKEEQEKRDQKITELREKAEATKEQISSRLKELNETLTQNASDRKKNIDTDKDSDLEEIEKESSSEKERIDNKKNAEIERLMAIEIPSGLSKTERAKRVAERTAKIAKQAGHDVVHGIIREVSLVLAGANPGAFIDDVVMHGDGETGIVIGYNEMIMGQLEHSADEPDKKKEEEKIEPNDKSDNGEKKDDKVETIEDIFKSMNEKQQTAVFAMMAEFVDKENPKKEDDESKGGDDNMKHNVFDTDKRDDKSFLSHADQEEILKLAKTSQVGTFQSALEIYANENALQHDALASGFAQTGDGNVTLLFPEYKDVRPGAPELITNDQGWITTVMNKVHKSPISRIRTRQADIRNIDTLRAKGYKKGKEKAQAGNFKLVRRTTDPQTVYIKDALNRDDIVDITDFDYVSYLYNIDRMMLNEELATAIMLGDGRDDGDEGKISPDHIRPIWLDDDLYTIHVDLDVAAAKKELQGTNTAANFGENYIIAEAMINTALYARENYKGKWLYIQFVLDGVQYTGFSSSAYLAK